ncbi:MAG: conjugal transfer protein TraG, partial [Desulfuromonadaceae bacterium]|nr:conjugal transfer protein TraG [Desulfuromonadaceae bacterium]
SSSQVVGTRVESKQNLAGSAATQEFREGRSIDAGTAATTIAVGQGALHETAGLISDASAIVRPNMKLKQDRENRMEKAQRAEETARRDSSRTAAEKSHEVYQGIQRTSKILQNQSKSSNLPKGPASPLTKGR